VTYVTINFGFWQKVLIEAEKGFYFIKNCKLMTYRKCERTIYEIEGTEKLYKLLYIM